MRFDYPHTCPEIDKNIERFEVEINTLKEDLKDVFSNCDKDLDTDYIFDTIKGLSQEFKYYAEAIRKTNSDMRYSADKIIDTLSDDVYHLNLEIEDLKQQIEEKE